MYVSFFEQKLVKNNKDVLASLRNSFDKQEQSLELVRRLKSKYKETLNGKADFRFPLKPNSKRLNLTKTKQPG